MSRVLGCTLRGGVSPDKKKCRTVFLSVKFLPGAIFSIPLEDASFCVTTVVSLITRRKPMRTEDLEVKVLNKNQTR